MAVERDRATADAESRVAFDDDARLVPRKRAGARVANARDCTAVDQKAIVPACHDPAVAGRVADTNDILHDIFHRRGSAGNAEART